MIIIIDYKSGEEVKIIKEQKEEEKLSSSNEEIINKDRELQKQVINIHGEIVTI